MRWKETSMTLLELPETFTKNHFFFQEEEPLKWKSPTVYKKKLRKLKVLNNFHSKHVNIAISIINFFIVAFALEAIPRTLASNCGVDVIRVITELR